MPRMECSAGTAAVVAELARQSEEVVECHRVTGDDCFVMTAHVRDVEVAHRRLRWDEAFVFFKHEDEARGPAYALRFGALLGR